jgi:hypothetical protein
MVGRLLGRLFLLVTSRPMLIVLGVALAALCMPMIAEQWRFVRAFVPGQTTLEAVREVEGIVDGLAGILVAAGVFIESRDTIRKLGAPVGDRPEVEARLNEVAHQNGIGLLLVGLLMEIGTLLTGLPARVLDVRAWERGILVACTALSVVAVIILYDFVKDYLLTYRMRG